VVPTVVAPPSSVVKCVWEVLVWGFVLVVYVCVSVSGVLFSVGGVCVCVCDLLIFLQVVPEPLYWYRLAGGGMLSESIGGSQLATAQRSANLERSLRPYLRRLGGWSEAQDLVRLAQGMQLSLPAGAGEGRVRPGVA